MTSSKSKTAAGASGSKTKAKAEEKAEEKAETQGPPEHGDEATESKTDRTAKGEQNEPERANNVEHDGEQVAPAPDEQGADGGNAAGQDATTEQRGAFRDTLGTVGEPQPAKVAKGMARPETGVSPEVPDHVNGVPTAAYGDDERNGKPTGIPVDYSGELRQREDAVPTAAYGQDARNGHVTGMAAEGQLTRDFGGNEEPGAKLAGSGVRGERGVGTLDPDLEPDERPQYPSTTLTRSGPNAAPMEPEDVKRATEPRRGDVKTSTDPTLASAAMPSMPGDQTVKLVNSATGEEVKPSEFFEVPDGVQARSFRRVKHRVSEVYTVRNSKDPSQRLLFTAGQLVDVDAAETLIALHG